MPHLSHLGVRARQEHVVFVACEDEAAVQEQLLPLLGQDIALSAGAQGFSVRLGGGGGGSASGSGEGAASSGSAPAPALDAKAKPASIRKVSSVEVVPLQSATSETCGAKAAACGHLLRMAAATGSSGGAGGNGAGAGDGSGKRALFRAPDGVVLPFGCMEAAVKAGGKSEQLEGLLRDLKSQLASWQASPVPGSGGSGGGAGAAAAGQPSPAALDALDALCADIRGLLESLELPQAALAQVADAFDPGRFVGSPGLPAAVATAAIRRARRSRVDASRPTI